MADPGTEAEPDPFPLPPGPPKRRLLLPSFVGYDRRWFGVDVVAGLTVWAVLVPESLAYASIAGVSPVVGLYAAPPALLFYALFGSSRHLIVGPMSATAALSAAAVATLATGGPQNTAAFTAALAITTGVLAMLGGLLRFGFLASLISEPVLKGFIVGLALTIIIGQVPKLFGISKGEGGFFRQLGHVVTHLGATNGWTLLVGAGSLAVVLGMRRYTPAIPGELVAVILSVVAANVFDLASHGVALVGHIDSGLPSFGLPHGLEVQDYFATVASAAGIMLVGFAEGLGAAKSYASRNHYDIDANRELLGLGAANVGAGLCSGMVVNGSLSKTAINGAAGARSQWSGLTAAALTIVTLLFLTELFEDLPEATLAAIVIAALILLVDFPKLFDYYRLYSAHLGRIYGRAARADFIAAVGAMLGVLVFDTLPGLFIGIAISMALLLYRASVPYVAVLGRLPGPWLPVRGPEPPCRRHRRPRRPCAPDRGRPVLRQRRPCRPRRATPRPPARREGRRPGRRDDRVRRRHGGDDARRPRRRARRRRGRAGHGPERRPGPRLPGADAGSARSCASTTRSTSAVTALTPPGR